MCSYILPRFYYSHPAYSNCDLSFCSLLVIAASCVGIATTAGELAKDKEEAECDLIPLMIETFSVHEAS